MHSKSDNVEIMMGFDTNEIIEKLFNSLLQIYLKGLEESMRGSDFVFDYVESLNYIFHKIDLKRGGSYTEAPEWIKNKKATIDPKYDDEKCFQYALTIALNHEQIGYHAKRVSKVKPFIDKYDWNEINFPSHKFSINFLLLVIGKSLT